MIRAFCLGLAAASALAASPALAQDDEEPPRILSVGVGGQILPQYPGADEYRLGPLFTGFVRREGAPIPFRTPDDGIGIGLLGRDSVVDFGPLIQFQGERDEEDVGAPVGDVDFAVEAGAFVNLNISPNFRLRFEGLKGITGHDGLVGNVAADFAVRSQDTLFTIGPRVSFADEDYMQTYFGTNTGATPPLPGFPVYDPDGGVRALGVMAGLTHQLTRSFGVYGYAGYERLVGDAADSPIVTNFGSRDQFSAGLALFVSFSIGNPF
jgi:outer membrane protein